MTPQLGMDTAVDRAAYEEEAEISNDASLAAIYSRRNKSADESEPLLGQRQKYHRTDTNKSDAIGEDDFEEFAQLPWYRRPSLYWVLLPFGLLALCYGGIIAPRVNLILNLVCREYFEDRSRHDPTLVLSPVLFDGRPNDQCRDPAVQARASNFALYMNLIAGLLSAVTTPKIGALSDRYGRTKLIALTSVGSLLSDVLFVLAAKMPGTLSMNWILVGYAFDGLCGSFTTAFAIVHAYVSDCVEPANRSVAFAFFHGCLFTGLAVGPILAALLTKFTGTPVSVFYVMLGIHAFFVLFMTFIAPESVTARRRARARKIYKRERESTSTDWLNKLKSINLFEPLKILWPTGDGTATAVRHNLAILASIDTIMFGVAMGSMSVVIMYANYRFGWQTYESGVYMSIVNTCRVFCLIAVLPLVTRVFRGKSTPESRAKSSRFDKFDLGVVRVAVFFDTLGYAGYSLSPTGSFMITSGVVASIGGIASPTLQAALTKHVPRDKIGQLLGASGLLHALSRVVAPTIVNGLYSMTVATRPQVVFYCLASTFGVAFVLTWFLRTGLAVEDPIVAEDVDGDETAAGAEQAQSAS